MKITVIKTGKPNNNCPFCGGTGERQDIPMAEDRFGQLEYPKCYCHETTHTMTEEEFVEKLWTALYESKLPDTYSANEINRIAKAVLQAVTEGK